MRSFSSDVRTANRISPPIGARALVQWVKIAAIREAIDLTSLTSNKPEELDDDITDWIAAPVDIEQDYLKRRYLPDLKAAMRQTFRSLPRKQRHLLRLDYVAGIKDEKIAEILDVSRATVIRWRAKAHERLMLKVPRLFGDRLDLPPAECASLIELLRSQLAANLARILEETHDESHPKPIAGFED